MWFRSHKLIITTKLNFYKRDDMKCVFYCITVSDTNYNKNYYGMKIKKKKNLEHNARDQ